MKRSYDFTGFEEGDVHEGLREGVDCATLTQMLQELRGATPDRRCLLLRVIGQLVADDLQTYKDSLTETHVIDLDAIAAERSDIAHDMKVDIALTRESPATMYSRMAKFI